MQLIFVRGDSPMGLAVCALTWSTWSHVGIGDGDAVIHATASHGVVRSGRAGFLQAFPKHAVVDVAVPDEDAGLAFGREQLGKPYDWTAVAGFLMPWRRWQDDRAWFCSELAAGVLAKAGWAAARVDAWRVTPRALRAMTRCS